MLYHLLAPLGKHYLVFNLLNYISFRAAAATVTAIIMAFLIGPPIIARLRARKIGQVVRAEGPASHHGKRGTPTMGGVIILLSALVPTLLWAPLTNRFVLFAMLATLWMGAIGFLDDYLKVVQGKSRGLVARWKLAGQFGFGLALGAYLIFSPVVSTTIMPATATTVPFFKFVVVTFAPWAYLAFVTFIVAGTSNGVNLSDGLDGLAIGCTLIVSFVFVVLTYLAGHRTASAYLQIPHVVGAGELTVFCAAMIGAGLGFLWFNCHPAQVFMGDTGSLALGGALGIIAVLIHQPLVLVIAGGVFVMEAASVILQTGWYRYTKRRYGTGARIFLMAPIHHHFEKKGWYESQVVIRFYILGVLCAVVALSTLKIR